MGVTQIVASLDIYSDPETGAEHILLPDKDIQKIGDQISRMQAEVQALERAKGGDPLDAPAKRIVIAQWQAIYDQESGVRKKYLPLSERRTYVLRKPTWEEWRQALEDVRVDNADTGEFTYRMDRMQDILLPKMCPEAVTAPLNIATYLWNLLEAALTAQNARLPLS